MNHLIRAVQVLGASATICLLLGAPAVAIPDPGGPADPGESRLYYDEPTQEEPTPAEPPQDVGRLLNDIDDPAGATQPDSSGSTGTTPAPAPVESSDDSMSVLEVGLGALAGIAIVGLGGAAVVAARHRGQHHAHPSGV